VLDTRDTRPVHLLARLRADALEAFDSGRKARGSRDRNVIVHFRQAGDTSLPKAPPPAAKARIAQTVVDVLLGTLFCFFVFVVAYGYGTASLTMDSALMNLHFLQ
jgi:hypothetical protein